MFRHLKTNPIVCHRLNNTRPPTLRTLVIGTAVFASGLTIVLLMVPFEQMWIFTHVLWQLPVPAPSIGNIVFTLFPIGVAGGAALVTAPLVAESLELLRITNLSARSIVEGLLIAALYRMRVWLSVQPAMLPLIIATRHRGLVDLFHYGYTVAWTNPPLTVTSDTRFILLGAEVFHLLATLIGLISFPLLAACIGVYIVIRYQNGIWAGLSAAGLMTISGIVGKLLQLAHEAITLRYVLHITRWDLMILSSFLQVMPFQALWIGMLPSLLRFIAAVGALILSLYVFRLAECATVRNL